MVNTGIENPYLCMVYDQVYAIHKHAAGIILSKTQSITVYKLYH